MSTNNPWLTPYQRSYDSIKSQLILKLKQNVPQLTDLSEGNIFILIISVLAAIAEVLHYYIDSNAQEMFFTTARRYSSLMKHAKLVDYHIKSAIAATVDVYLYRSSGEPFGIDFNIPEGTRFNSSDGKPFHSTKSISVKSTDYIVKIPLIQRELGVNREVIGTLTSANSEIYLPETNSQLKYQEGSMLLEITYQDITESWKLVDTFAYSTSGDKVYKVELGDNQRPKIIFGTGLNGMRPSIGSTLIATYYYTYGASGNVAINSISQVPSVLNNLGISDLVMIQPNDAAGGSDYENFDMLKAHVPLSIKTLGVAITKEDFESIARLHPGVDKAYANYRCGKYVELYISPDGGTEASSVLRESLEIALNQAKVITSNIEVYSTHVCQIILNIQVWGRKSYLSLDILNQVRRALLNQYSEANTDIALPVYLSDIYALVDNCSMVDHSKVISMYMWSYWQPSLTINEEEINVENVRPYTLKGITIRSNELTQEAKVIVAFTQAENSPKRVTLYVEGTSFIITAGVARAAVYTGAKGSVTFDILISQEDIDLYTPGVKYTSILYPNGLTMYTPQSYQMPVLYSNNLSVEVIESL